MQTDNNSYSAFFAHESVSCLNLHGLVSLMFYNNKKKVEPIFVFNLKQCIAEGCQISKF